MDLHLQLGKKYYISPLPCVCKRRSSTPTSKYPAPNSKSNFLAKEDVLQEMEDQTIINLQTYYTLLIVHCIDILLQTIQCFSLCKLAYKSNSWVKSFLGWTRMSWKSVHVGEFLWTLQLGRIQFFNLWVVSGIFWVIYMKVFRKMFWGFFFPSWTSYL